MGTKVFAAGTFDGLHEGHRFFLREAKTYGDELVVVVARDTTVERIKNHRPRFSEEERLAEVKKDPSVHEAVLGNSTGSPFDILCTIRPDVIVLGYDQPVNEEKLLAFLKEHDMAHVPIHRGTPFKPWVYKSSLLSSS